MAIGKNMPTREDISRAAEDFLRAVAKAARERLGPRPERTQRAVWMVTTASGSGKGVRHERRLLDAARISMLFQIDIQNSPEQVSRLTDILSQAGIAREYTYYGFMLPLMHHYLDGIDSLDDEGPITKVVSEFLEAVVNKRIVTRSVDVIVGLDFPNGPFTLDENVSIKAVTEEELWEFGDQDQLRPMHIGPWEYPSDHWSILEVRVEHCRQESTGPGDDAVYALSDAGLMALHLATPQPFGVIPGWQESNYGIGSLGRRSKGGRRQLVMGFHTKALDSREAALLGESWQRLRPVLTSERHYLRLPARRLLDGLNRDRPDDAIIDYVIGLEALLLSGIRDELTYRFSLRGAAVLAWESGERRRQAFGELQDLYEVRSRVVHGSHVAREELARMSQFGQKALREIWWWCFRETNQGQDRDLQGATAKVDMRILGD